MKIRIVTAIACGLLGVVSAFANSPRLASITPPGAQRGTEVELRFEGTRLSETKEIVIYSPGLEVLGIESARTNSIKAKVRIAPDCPLGEHPLRLRTATGVSELRTFWVGPFPTVAESEPNQARTNAQRVAVNSTVTGVITDEDVDSFVITAKKGDRLSAEVEAIRLGRSVFDAYLTLLNPAGTLLAKADDSSLAMQDPILSVVAPADGDYVFQLRETSYGGRPDHHYRLHLGNFPRPLVVYPAGGPAGETLSVRFIGAGDASWSQQIKLPAQPGERFGAVAEQGGVLAPSPNWMRVSPFGNALEAEPNDTREQAGEARDLPLAFNGIIGQDGDHDWFRFRAKKGVALQVSVFARRLRSPLDSAIQIVGPGGKPAAENDDAGGPDSALAFTPGEDGDYAILIRDHLKRGGPDHVYRIEIAPSQPSLSVKIPDVARNDTQTRQWITVPKGNRFAALVSVKRTGFSGNLDFRVEGLPDGVAMHADTMSLKIDSMPLVFEAAPDAAVSGKLLDLTARTVNGAAPVEGHFRNDIELVQGPNNTAYYVTRVDKLMVAVTEPAPFRVRIAEPKVPLVQGGTMELKIVAERDKGFDEPISLKLLWNPPGITAATDVTIPKGETAALYRLDAKADAATQSWKIAVLASAKLNGGDVLVSSQLAPIEVGTPFVAGKIDPVVASPGDKAKIVCKLEQKQPFSGRAKMRLLGLPEKITAPLVEITKESQEAVFELSIDPKISTGSHRQLFCAVEIEQGGEKIPHNIASGGILRIVPPKKAIASTAETKVVARNPGPGK